MKTLANCNPVEFLKQTNKIRHAVSHLLQDSGVMEIRKHLPKLTGEESPQEKKEKEREQSRKNMNDILDALMEKDAEKTASVLGLMCFMNEKDMEKAKGVDFLVPAMELLTSKPVLDFLSLYTKWDQTNTEG